MVKREPLVVMVILGLVVLLAGACAEPSPTPGAFRQMSEEESLKIAEEFVRNSPTFAYDGIEDSFRLADTLRPRCPYCWVFVFRFESRHTGYGDSRGQMIAQLITPHKASIAVEQLEITSAMMDDRWDMLRQEMVDEQGEPPPEVPVPVSVEASCNDFKELQHISQEVRVPADGSVELALCSNPINDFQWDLPQIADQAVLEWVSHRFEAVERWHEDQNDCGGIPPRPYREEWTFKALKKGETTISMEYGQLWEGGRKAIRTFDLTVVVK